MNTSFPGAQIRASALCLLAVLVPACTGFDEASDADDDVRLTVASQAIGTAPPIHDPRLCHLPEGRFVVFATPTTTPNAYNVQYINDAVPGSKPSSSCQTITFVWNLATAPVPPQVPPDDQFYRMAFEGWSTLAPAGFSYFAVKATYRTPGVQGVVTAVSGVRSFGYAILTGDLGIPMNQRFNWIGPGSDVFHSVLVQIPLPNQGAGLDKDFTIALTGPNLDRNGFLNPVQYLYVDSGSSRIYDPRPMGLVATRPCSTVCPPPAP
jgi:hypothetical protein